jgi:hypothetical protein
MPDNAVDHSAGTGPSLPEQAFSASGDPVRRLSATTSGAIRPSATTPVPGR